MRTRCPEPGLETPVARRQFLQVSAGAGLAAGLTLHALPAGAQSLPATETPPAELAAEQPALVLVGAARMRFWGLDIYDARLWAGSGFRASTYAASPFALELNYLRSLSGKAIAERSLKEMQRQGSMRPEQESSWLAAMERAFVDVKSGDRITGAHTPGAGARFWYNAAPRPGVADAEFSRLFFGIWLSDATSEPDMRKRLTGRAAA